MRIAASFLPLLAMASPLLFPLLPPNAIAMPIATPVVSDFDVDLEGWTGNSITHQSAGGNPDGYLLFVEASQGDIGPFAPATFLGDWSALDGVESIRYDERIFSSGDFAADGNGNREVTISGPGGSATWIGPRSPGFVGKCKAAKGSTCWPTTFTIPISETAWTVTSGSWPFLLADVTELQIRGNLYETTGTPEEVGFDNVVITPEPVTGFLLALGLGLVGVARAVGRRRSQWPAP